MNHRPSNASTISSPYFGRTPVRVYLVVALVGLAGVLGAFAALTPWYLVSATLPAPTENTTYVEGFTPGPGGYIDSCAYFYHANYSTCSTVGTTYGGGNGSELLAGLYLGLLGGSVALSLLSFGGILTLLSGAVGGLRVRRTRSLLVTLTVAALVIGLASAIAMPALQGPALGDTGACAGFDLSQTPCNSVFGHAGGIGCAGGTCVETDLNWHPGIGWYLALSAIALLLGVLVTLRYQPLGAPCPSCGVLNRFHGQFCDACGSPLPWHPGAVKPTRMRWVKP